MSIASIFICIVAILLIDVSIWFVGESFQTGLSAIADGIYSFCSAIDSFFSSWWLVGGLFHLVLSIIFFALAVAVFLLCAACAGAGLYLSFKDLD